MTKNLDLSGKTFDQQLEFFEKEGKDIENRDISPNRRIVGEIVLEPMLTGVRVTARDDRHRLLWGFVASKETNKQVHCLVATYDTLQNLIVDELSVRGKYIPDEKNNPIVGAKADLENLEQTIVKLRKSLDVKKVSDATLERAREIGRIASDAERQITLEVSSLKGMKTGV